MQLTVKRFGGIIPMKPRSRTFELENLDSSTKEALSKAMDAVQPEERHPDGFEYSFEVEDSGQAGANKVVISGPLVPPELRKLLP